MKNFFVYLVIVTFIVGTVGQQTLAQSDTTAPAIPRGFDAAGGPSGFEFVVTWINPADTDLDHVNVYLSPTGGFSATSVWQTVSAQPNTKSTVTLTNLASGTNYYLYLATVDATGNRSVYTVELKRTTANTQDSTSPAAAVAFTAQDTQAGGSVRLAWTTPSDDDFFQARLYRATEQEFAPSSANEIAQVFGQPSALASYTDTGLTNGTIYYYKIRSEDVRGNVQTGLFYPSASAIPTYVAPLPAPEPVPTPDPTPEPAPILISDGDLIRAQNTQDIFIVKIVGTKKFKRLILNPAIFDSYGHLRWDAVKEVSQSTLDTFMTSDLVMEVNSDGTPTIGRVYRVSSSANSDTGTKQWFNMTAAQFEAQYDWSAIYHINHIEAGENFYTTGVALAT